MYAVVGVVGIFIIVNVLYLLPVKIFEICRLVKRIFVYIYDKVKLLFKTKPPVLKQSADGSIYSGDPTISSAINLNRPSIQVVPKQYYMYQERKNRKLNKSIITEFSFRGNSQQANFNINEEEKVPGSRGILLVLFYIHFKDFKSETKIKFDIVALHHTVTIFILCVKYRIKCSAKLWELHC